MVDSPSRHLTASQAAWLARVNDDRVRAWFKDDRYPSTPQGEQRTTTTWEDLSVFCSRMRRAQPLPLELLDMSPEAVARLLDKGRPHAEESGAQLHRLTILVDSLRRAAREEAAASLAAQGEAAAHRRAFLELIDALEETGRA